MHHLLQRRGDQPGQADHIGALLARRLEDLVRRHHDAEIDDLVVVALQHDADDVLADVVHVALDGGHHDTAARGGHPAPLLLRLDEGQQMGDRLLHDAGALDHLGQEHLARAEQIADHVHAVHQRPLDDVERGVGKLARLFGVVDDEFVDPAHQRVGQPFRHRRLAPREIGLLLDAAAALVGLRDLEQALGGVGAPVQDDVLDPLAEFGLDVLVDRELAGIHDAHGQTGADRVVKEHRVHRLAHPVVAAERERDVADAAADAGMGEGFLDPRRRRDEVDGVVVVFLDPGGDGEDIGIEDDVLRRQADLVDQNLVGAGADGDLALGGVGLALLVEGHDDHRRAVAADEPRAVDERRLAFLEADGIHHRLALDAFEPGLDHRPFG